MWKQTLIDLIVTTVPELCSEAVSAPVGCSDHSLIAVVRKTKGPQSGQKCNCKRLFRENDFVEDVRSIDCSLRLR